MSLNATAASAPSPQNAQAEMLHFIKNSQPFQVGTYLCYVMTPVTWIVSIFLIGFIIRGASKKAAALGDTYSVFMENAFSKINTALVSMSVGIAISFTCLSLLFTNYGDATATDVRNVQFTILDLSIAIWESGYCYYIWLRSQGILQRQSKIVYNLFLFLRVSNPIVFVIQAASGIYSTFVNTDAANNVHNYIGVTASVAIIIFDTALLASFIQYLYQNRGSLDPANSESEAEYLKTVEVTTKMSIISSYGIVGSIPWMPIPFLLIVAILPSQALNFAMLEAIAFTLAGLCVINLVAMKVRLESVTEAKIAAEQSNAADKVELKSYTSNREKGESKV
ncbi:hypothetical protein BC830DRAFT_1122075 [Chytriomyces sp. MP71]|nr:hypothetical protein BC830DRAFT_1122075 [Chytriomyces sp. MP71]